MLFAVRSCSRVNGELPEMGLTVIITIASRLLLQSSSLSFRDLPLEHREARFANDDITGRTHFILASPRRCWPKNVRYIDYKAHRSIIRIHVASSQVEQNALA
jgi:hypothetical protein